MRVLLQNIILPFWVEDEEILASAVDKMRRSDLDPRTLHFRLYKKSWDARKRNEIKVVCSVLVELPDTLGAQPSVQKALLKAGAVSVNEAPLSIAFGKDKMYGRPMVVGMGPAGLFCALLLAENGYAPILIDRGESVENRVADVNAFYQNGVLDADSNIQFGAGGAGTFSDGKLITRINDEKCNYVLTRLHEFGAPDEILTKAKPHIGTDRLRGVVKAILTRIEQLGGRVLYRCRMEHYQKNTDGGLSVKTSQGDFSCGTMVLAIGHSARDTVQTLVMQKETILPKPFSVGVRIEHRKEDIDRALYGSFAGHPKLGAGEYNLSDTKSGRGVYTFCMCPGGEVVAAASEAGGVVVNGMSCFARDGVNSNAAIAVSVRCEDYGCSVEKAIQFQRSLEQAAFRAGGNNYHAPVQTVGDFTEGRLTTEPKRILPSYMGGNRYQLARIDTLLPPFVTEELRRGIASFGRRIEGFDAPDAVLTGVETRTSSPIRILRNADTLNSVASDLVYPCGEGAGYAGGITSAAVDGIGTALAIMRRYAPCVD